MAEDGEATIAVTAREGPVEIVEGERDLEQTP